MDSQVLDPERIDELCASLSALIFPPGVRLVYARIDQIGEQSVNPRAMPQKMFDQLIENIKESQFLESVPLCVQSDGELKMVSGHHRLRAARAAGLSHILVIVYESLSPSRVKSKQLAHNTISGTDNLELVKRVWDEITEVRARFEAYVDPRLFKNLPEPVKFKPVDVDMQALAKTVLIVFLPSQKQDFDKAVAAIMPNLHLDSVYLASKETYDGWVKALVRVQSDLEIVSVPVAIAEMARLVIAYLDSQSVANNHVGKDGENGHTDRLAPTNGD
jgi:hypothetical protein